MNATRRSMKGGLGLVMIGLLLAPPALAASGRAAIITASAARRQVRAGDTVTVTVRIRNAREVGSVPFTLRYDPSILEVIQTTAAEGDFLRRDGATSFLVGTGSAARGSGLVVGLSRLGSGRGARGAGTLFSVTFRARQPGVSPIAFSHAALLDPAARPLPSQFRGSSITVRPAP